MARLIVPDASVVIAALARDDVHHRAALTAKARHPILSVPDAITLVVAELVRADAVWTFDRRWAGIDVRATVP